MANKKSPKNNFNINSILKDKNLINKLLKKIEEITCLHIDKQIEAEAEAAPPEEEEESFVPKQDKFIKEDIKLKKEMNDIMKSVLSES